MRIGFTGTRNGMTPEQLASFLGVVQAYQPAEFHHGDCIGADDQAASMVRSILGTDCRIIAHPGFAMADGPDVKSELRANNPNSDEVYKPRSHFARNRVIVACTDLLVAASAAPIRQLAGGTWYTIDHAIHQGRPVIVLWPDGLQERTNLDRLVRSEAAS